MAFAPTLIEDLARARGDLRMGVPVVLDAAQPMLVLAAESLTSERLRDLRGICQPEIVLTARRASTLKAVPYDGDLARISVPDDKDLWWVRGMADPKYDMDVPMKGPFQIARGGDASLHRLAIQLVKTAHLLPSALVVPLENAAEFATTHRLTLINAAAAGPTIAAESALHPVAAARLPMAASESGRLHIFRPEDGNEEHYAVEIGTPSRKEPVLARLHSACFTGDVLGSLKCDCGPQLNGALAQMGAEGAGILLYLNQEGRGIGLANKMRAYALQDQGFDTVEANHRLGFEDDERDFRIGAAILKRLGFQSVRLMTNNPKKIAMMEKMDVAVTERVPLILGQTPQNMAYLATKAKKSGHLL